LREEIITPFFFPLFILAAISRLFILIEKPQKLNGNLATSNVAKLPKLFVTG
jgi:hypothetical protein